MLFCSLELGLVLNILLGGNLDNDRALDLEQFWDPHDDM